jgi:WD40 repeat protein
VATDPQSPNREFLAFVPDDGQYLTVDVLDQKTKRQRELRHDGEVESVAWSPDSTLVATASDDGAARVWTPAGRQVSIEQGHRGAVASVAFDPDGKLLITASATDGTARIWDAESGDQLAVFGGGPGAKALDAAAFSPDGRLVVTRAVDGSVAVYSCPICAPLDELVADARLRAGIVPFRAG